MEKTGDRTWHWTLTGPPNIDNWAGKRFIIEGSNRSHAFEMRNLHDTTIEDVNYWGGGANAGFYIGGLEGTTTFRHFVIGVPPGSGRLYSCGGGGQISGQRGILIFDGCDFSKIDDDGIDILSTWTRIIAQPDPRTLVVQSAARRLPSGRPHRSLGLASQEGALGGGLTTATRNPDGSFTLALDRDVVTERVGPGGARPSASRR